MQHTGIFPQRLRQARKHRGLKQADLAELCRFDPSLISHYEIGHRSPGITNLCLLSSSLRVSADWLIGRSSILQDAAKEPDHTRRDIKAEIALALKTL